jgi:hypothetical protein
VVEVAGPDCAATQGHNNNDMSTALQTNVADMEWKASAQKCSAPEATRERILRSYTQNSPG